MEQVVPIKKLYEHFGITSDTLKKINKRKIKNNIMKIAINGFGRIGKLVFRAFLEKKLKNIDIVAINELGSLESSHHLMQFDSTHGSYCLLIY